MDTKGTLDDVMAKLESRVKTLIGKYRGSDKRARVLIVDDECSFTLHGCSEEQIYREHITHEDISVATALNAGVHLDIVDISHQEAVKIKERYFETAPEIAIVVENTGRRRIAEEIMTLSAVQTAFPDTEIFYFSTSAMNTVLEHILEEFSKVNPQTIDIDEFPTGMHMLSSALTGRKPFRKGTLSQRRHDYKNRMWRDQYVHHIGRSLRAGNSQTSMNYHFLILSNQEKFNVGDQEIAAEEKVKVKKADYHLEADDFARCAAIFIDNEWNELIHRTALGEGIKTLRRVRKELDERGISIPIIYQSGHSADNFTESEKESIASMGAVLATKDIFPKVCAGKEAFEKEVEIRRAIKMPELLDYISQLYEFKSILRKDNFFVLCSKMVDESSCEDRRKRELFAGLGIENEKYSTRMYVLSMLHESLKGDAGSTILGSSRVPDFYSFEQLEARNGGSLEMRETYEKAISRRGIHEKSTIIHNDAKWDNWIGTVLSDFSDATAGSESKDIARALLDNETDFENVKNIEWVMQKAAEYARIRKAFGDYAKDEKELAKDVICMAFIEALRLATKTEDYALKNQLMEVAKTYEPAISSL